MLGRNILALVLPWCSITGWEQSSESVDTDFTLVDFKFATANLQQKLSGDYTAHNRISK